MKTVCIQVGNSDDKLTQSEWHRYVVDVDEVIMEYQSQRHFAGGSICSMPWQNYCWVCVVGEERMSEFFLRLSATGTKYDQDSVAVTVGDTQFI